MGPRRAALVRLAGLPVIWASERLVNHPQSQRDVFDALLIVATIYALVLFVNAWRGGRLATRRWLVPAADCALLFALTWSSGGPFSQLRFAFFLLPVLAIPLLSVRLTAWTGAFSIAAYGAISLLHPATDTMRDALEFEVAQLVAMAWLTIAAILLTSLLERRTRQVEQLAEQRGRLVAQALAAEDRARRRLAEALHDEAIQNLLAARQELSSGPQADLALARVGLDRTVSQLRDAVFDLHPTVLEHAGLAAAIEAVAERQGRRGGFEAWVDVDADATSQHDGLVFSLARELITNAAKHARARSVHVRVRRIDGDVVLEVRDDGAGIDPGRVAAAPGQGHIGLASTRERAEALGGRLELLPAPSGGTIARVRLPVAVHAAV